MRGPRAFQRAHAIGTARAARRVDKEVTTVANAYSPEDLAKRTFLLVVAGIAIQISVIVVLVLI
jgi:hypothetical protein